MSGKLDGLTAEQKETFAELNAMKYSKQAVWFLNSFWSKHFSKSKENCEDMWKYVQCMSELNGEDSNRLDEFKAHQFLEKCYEVLSALKMREVMREIDVNFDKHVSLTEFLIFKYDLQEADINTLLNAGLQSSTPETNESINKAKTMCDEAFQAMTTATEKADASRKAAEELAAAEAEAQAALDALNKEIKARDDKIVALEKKVADGSLSVVKKGVAVQELAKLKGEDTLPIRRAQITQKAATRRVGKAKKAADKAKEEAEKAEQEATEAYKKARKFLDDLMESSKGAGLGSLWWMSRELEEKKKYMSKAQIAKIVEQQNELKREARRLSNALHEVSASGESSSSSS